MKKFFLFLLVIIITLTGCETNKKIEINSPAYIYNSDLNISEKISIKMSGFYNNKGSFKGSIIIKDKEYQSILFTPGSGLISYEGKKRTYLGQIFFNNETLQYSIEISDTNLYFILTQKKYDNKKLIISSPADNLEKAKQINLELKKE